MHTVPEWRPRLQCAQHRCDRLVGKAYGFLGVPRVSQLERLTVSHFEEQHPQTGDHTKGSHQVWDQHAQELREAIRIVSILPPCRGVDAVYREALTVSTNVKDFSSSVSRSCAHSPEDGAPPHTVKNKFQPVWSEPKAFTSSVKIRSSVRS